MKTKRCSTCKDTKSIEEFCISRSRPDGLNHVCKGCVKKRNRIYRENNAEKIRDKKRAYYNANYDKIRAYTREYYNSNRDWYMEYSRQWKSENPDKVAKYRRRSIEELRDGYVSKTITQGLPIRPEEIPEGLIELKRAQLLIARELRNK